MRAALESTVRDLEAAQRQCQSLKRERADRLGEAEALRSALAEQDHGLRERVDALESSAQHAQQDWEQKEALLASRLRALDTQLSASADERDRLQERLERLTEAHTKVPKFFFAARYHRIDVHLSQSTDKSTVPSFLDAGH